MSFLLTSFMNTLKDMKALVLKTKIDECLLNYFWEKLEQMYSEKLLLLAKRMLSQYTEERPTLTELKECLSKMCRTEEPVMRYPSEEIEPIENVNSFSDLLGYMSKYSVHSSCVIEGLIKLNKLLVKTPDIDPPVDAQSFIWILLCENLDNAELLTEGLHVIEKFTSISNDHLQNIFSESTIDSILTIMECQLKETVFLTVIYSFLVIILTSESATNYFNTKGGMSTLLNRLPKDLTDDTTVSAAAMTLSNLIVNPSNAKAALEYGIIKVLYENLQFHFNYQGAVAELLAVFIPLATNESAIFQLNQCQLLTLFVNIMNTYCSNDAIVMNCCIILRDVLNSISIYDDGILELTETSAVSAMISVLYSNTESSDVIIECCTTLAALCNMSNEACKDLISYEYEPMLKYCTTHFNYNEVTRTNYSSRLRR
ncbi:threonine kinase-like domain-containing STKLD1 [Octopus vulgaris]|uniref:Threonine kinase-like domain-containing STKLD1 n=1 Tax=Octopus vulgaris TaxID=6645 RepID=A0AA36FIG4_OCTVU|nr:threonine kinase-like domain-containing STKLD1 [Octopus vulgaris]